MNSNSEKNLEKVMKCENRHCSKSKKKSKTKWDLFA